MLAMAERDRIEISFRRFAAREFIEARVRKHLIDRAQAIGALGVAGWRDMVEACRVGQKQGGHNCSGREPWRLNLGSCEARGKGYQPASVPIPKFAAFCGILICELRNRRTLATY